MILGKNLIVSLNGTPIAAAKSCTFTVSQDFLQVCSPTTSRVFEKIPTTYDWSMSVNGLIANSSLPNSLINLLKEGTKVMLMFTDNSNQKRAGFAYVKVCEEGGSIGALATFSASFESTGPLYNYTALTPELFTEGNGVYIGISNNTITYIFNISTAALRGAGMAGGYNSGRFYIMTTNTWAAYKANFNTIKGYLQNQSTTDLNSKLFAFGAGDGFVIPDATESYTFLTNTDAVVLYLT